MCKIFAIQSRGWWRGDDGCIICIRFGFSVRFLQTGIKLFRMPLRTSNLDCCPTCNKIYYVNLGNGIDKQFDTYFHRRKGGFSWNWRDTYTYQHKFNAILFIFGLLVELFYTIPLLHHEYGFKWMDGQMGDTVSSSLLMKIIITFTVRAENIRQFFGFASLIMLLLFNFLWHFRRSLVFVYYFHYYHFQWKELTNKII